MTKKLHILAVTYGHDQELKCFINSILCQTNPNWTLKIVHDGNNSVLEESLKSNGYLDDSRIEMIFNPRRTKNYGHILRRDYIPTMPDDGYLLLTNGDNYYIPTFVEEVLNCIGFDDISLIYWNFQSHHSRYNRGATRLELSHIDMGSAAVKSSLAKKVGFESRSQSADWVYFRSIINSPGFIESRFISKYMFIHN